MELLEWHKWYKVYPVYVCVSSVGVARENSSIASNTSEIPEIKIKKKQIIFYYGLHLLSLHLFSLWGVIIKQWWWKGFSNFWWCDSTTKGSPTHFSWLVLGTKRQAKRQKISQCWVTCRWAHTQLWWTPLDFDLDKDMETWPQLAWYFYWGPSSLSTCHVVFTLSFPFHYISCVISNYPPRTPTFCSNYKSHPMIFVIVNDNSAT